VDNAHAAKPFGTLDTPGQGGTISGTDSVNFGWALTPQPAIIPIDGSTITVMIDGVALGHPICNQLRPDIANLFPGYANSAGAVGFFHINTTTLANGVHTISWNGFDNQARGEGLGSRYFNVLNTAGPVSAPEDVIPETAAKEGVQLRHGLNRRLRPIDPDSNGGYSVTMEEVGHIELHLGAVSGSMLVQGEPQSLPTGSTLKGGVFYWQPGPGFLGEYKMQFERPDGNRIPVRVNIVPKRYERSTISFFFAALIDERGRYLVENGSVPAATDEPSNVVNYRVGANSFGSPNGGRFQRLGNGSRGGTPHGSKSDAEGACIGSAEVGRQECADRPRVYGGETRIRHSAISGRAQLVVSGGYPRATQCSSRSGLAREAADVTP